jgi:hypothetical protein
VHIGHGNGTDSHAGHVNLDEDVYINGVTYFNNGIEANGQNINNVGVLQVAGRVDGGANSGGQNSFAAPTGSAPNDYAFAAAMAVAGGLYAFAGPGGTAYGDYSFAAPGGSVSGDYSFAGPGASSTENNSTVFGQGASYNMPDTFYIGGQYLRVPAGGYFGDISTDFGSFSSLFDGSHGFVERAYKLSLPGDNSFITLTSDGTPGNSGYTGNSFLPANSGGVITNNGIVWFALKTNGPPAIAAPNGSICTTTNGGFFVRSNAVWLNK